jgi:hypothetical protein
MKRKLYPSIVIFRHIEKGYLPKKGADTMNITERAIHAELKFLILHSAMMIQDGYTDQDVISRLMEAVDLLDNTEPNRR